LHISSLYDKEEKSKFNQKHQVMNTSAQVINTGQRHVIDRMINPSTDQLTVINNTTIITVINTITNSSPQASTY
jgi:hypothetical protein